MHQIFSFFSNLLCLPYAFIEPLSSLAHDPNHRHDLVGTVAAGGRHVPEVSLDRRPLGILVAFGGTTFLRHCRHMRHFAAIQDVVLREYNLRTIHHSGSIGRTPARKVFKRTTKSWTSSGRRLCGRLYATSGTLHSDPPNPIREEMTR